MIKNLDAQGLEALEEVRQLREQLSAKSYEYDVALSFAGENRDCASALADVLKKLGVKVFYDEYERSTLWGKNLYTYLSDIYQNKARYRVMLLSQHYAAKLWTNHEREAAQARAFSENEEYILPVRLDDTKIPGIPSTVAYLSWPPETAETIANAIMEKLGKEANVLTREEAVELLAVGNTTYSVSKAKEICRAHIPQFVSSIFAKWPVAWITNVELLNNSTI